MNIRSQWFSTFRGKGRGVVGLLALLLVLGLTSTCSEKQAPVGELAVSQVTVSLPYPERIGLPVSWTPSRRLEGLKPPLRVFVHLLGSEGEILRTFDHAFPDSWEPGRVVQYDVALFQSALGPPLPPGQYDLTIGLYDADGNRWPVDTSGEAVARDEYRVARVDVPLAAAPLPRFDADDAWAKLEPGGGAQILGRRWLTRSGNLTLTGIRSSGSVWMQLLVPAATSESQQLVLDPGADQQAVRVSTSCGPGEEFFTGDGSHAIRLAIDTPESFDPKHGCDIYFDANYQVVDLETLKRRVLQLEILTWIPSDRALGDADQPAAGDGVADNADEP